MDSFDFKAVISAAELVRRDWRPHGWLLSQMIPQGGITLLAGETASGKTLLGLDLALGTASGRGRVWDMAIGDSFEEAQITDPMDEPSSASGAASPRGRQEDAQGDNLSRVRYFCGDADPNLMAERVVRLCRGYPERTADAGWEVPDGLDLDFNAHEFCGYESFKWLQKEVTRKGYKLLIFDGLAQYLPGMADGSASAVGAFLRGARKLASTTGVSMVLIHQFNKRLAARVDKWGLPTSQGEERVRGSSELLAGVDCVLLVSRPEAMKLGGMGRTVVKVVKNRLGQAGTRLQFTIADGDESLHLLFERPSEEAQPKPRRLVDAVVDEMMRILMSEDEREFDRSELTKRLQERMRLPGSRTLAEAFGILGREERVRVERREDSKRIYSWAAPGTGAMEKSMYGLPPAMALDVASAYLLNKARLSLADQQMEAILNKAKPAALAEQLADLMKGAEGEEA